MLSSKAKYGLKAMVYLARNENQGAVVIQDIANAETIPKKFLDAIMLELKNNGLLTSKKGKGGGYMLAVPSARIRVGDIIRVLDGPLAPVPCASRNAYKPCADCRDEGGCAVRAVMSDVRDAIAAILDNCTLSDMASKGAGEMIINYEI